MYKRGVEGRKSNEGRVNTRRQGYGLTRWPAGKKEIPNIGNKELLTADNTDIRGCGIKSGETRCLIVNVILHADAGGLTTADP